MKKGLIFAGTTEGRLLAERFAKEQIPCVVCVATDYGAQMLPKEKALSQTQVVQIGRLEQIQMAKLFEKEQPAVVIDATHPYAVKATENIKNACEKTGYPYLRLLRAETEIGTCEAEGDSQFFFFQTMERAAQFLEMQHGNIFLTIGSKELDGFISCISDISRIYARILPIVDNLRQCLASGLSGRQLICMQGPFSEQLNEAMLLHCQAKWLVTKESGAAGGFLEKCQAARRLGISCVVIQRPLTEDGILIEQIWQKIQQYL